MEVDIRYALGITNVNTRAIKVLCPYHDDTSPSMAVYADGTRCFACGATETPRQFLERLEVDPDTLPQTDYQKERKRRGNSRTYRPETSVFAKVDIYHDLLMDENSPRHSKVQWYLDRGIFRHTIKKRKLGHTGDTFSLPVWYGDEITGIRFRLDEEYHEPEMMKKMKYFPPAGQPILLYRPRPHVGLPIITEGELDALALSQYGFDTVTTTGGSDTLHSHITPDRLRMKTIYVATDMDEAGNESYDKLCRVWKQTLPRLSMPKGMDVSKYLLSIESVNKREYIEEKLKEVS